MNAFKKWIYKKLGFFQISNNSTIDKSCNVFAPCDIRDGVSIGKFTYISPKCSIFNNVSIGNYCSIGYGVSIAPFEHPSSFLTTSPKIYKSDCIQNQLKWPNDDVLFKTTIDNDVWIGSNVIILQGVHISNGAIIAAGAVVTRDVPPYEIWGGIPARCIKKRFDQSMINELIRSEWWLKNPKEASAFLDELAKKNNIYTKCRGDDK